MDETKKRTYLIGLIIFSLLPAIALPALPKTLTATSGFLYISAIFGYIGIVLLLWMYALGAKSVFGVWFRDIAPITRIHRWLGKYGILLLLAHPIFILLSYGEELLYPLVPHLSTAFERHITLGRISLWLIIMLWLSSVLLRGKMGYRPWKYLHFLAYIALPFSLLHVPGTGSQFANDTFVKGYYFALVVSYFVVTMLRIRGLAAADANKARVIRHERIADGTYMVELDMPPESTMPNAGQYVYVRMGIISEDHPFSVAQVDEDKRHIVLAYRITGRYSHAMSGLQPSDEVYISEPYGAFLAPLGPDEQPVVFIAGGIGITPFMQAMLHERSPENTWLFYANRSHESTAFANVVSNRLDTHAIRIYSDEPALAPDEQARYLTKELLTHTLSSPNDYQYFICGPSGMMSHTQNVLTTLGLPAAQIHFEAFEF